VSEITKRLLRLRDILGDKKANPPIPPMIPISKSSWYAGIEAGRYPKPIYLGPNIAAWRLEDILRLVERGVAA